MLFRSRETLQEARLQRAVRLLWRRQAGLGQPLEGPIAWPLPPLRPGERLQVLLQPRDPPDSGFAAIDIQAAPAATLDRNTTRLTSLGADPEAWRKAVEQALEARDPALATALLFAFEGPSAPELDALRQEAFLHSCP